MKKSITVVSLSLLVATGATWATTHQPVAQPQQMPATDATATMTDGEVRKVDIDAKKITLKHAEIKNLGMPGMTMVFQVKDPAMLEGVKAGDKVRFTAEKINGAFTVTTLDAAK